MLWLAVSVGCAAGALGWRWYRKRPRSPHPLREELIDGTGQKAKNRSVPSKSGIETRCEAESAELAAPIGAAEHADPAESAEPSRCAEPEGHADAADAATQTAPSEEGDAEGCAGSSGQEDALGRAAPAPPAAPSAAPSAAEATTPDLRVEEQAAKTESGELLGADVARRAASSEVKTEGGEAKNAAKRECHNEHCAEKGRFVCTRCRTAYWCSPACQREGWKAHKKACRPRTLAADHEPSSSTAPAKESDAAPMTFGRTPATEYEGELGNMALEGGSAFGNMEYKEAKQWFRQMYDAAEEGTCARGDAARMLASAMDKLSEPKERIEPLLAEALKLGGVHNNFMLSFNALTGLGSHIKRVEGLRAASHIYSQALEMATRGLGELTWLEEAQALSNLAGCLGKLGPQEVLLARKHMLRALKLYQAHESEMEQRSMLSWMFLRANYASLLAETHPDLAVKEFKKVLCLLQKLPNPRLEEMVRINLNNSGIPQPELDARLYSQDCAICLESLNDPKQILACLHAFHTTCFPGGPCPLCRHQCAA